MEVKCPKCRFRYDTPVSSGVNEVACVCPRCGVPFTFAVGESPKDPQKWNDDIPAPQTEQATVAAEPQPANNARETASPTKESPSATTPPPFIPSITSRRSGNRAFQPERKDRGCLRNCLLVFIVTFVVAVFFIRNCSETHSYTSELFHDKEDTVEVTELDAAKADSDTPPHWLEGTWRLETEYGVVVVTIRGNKIVEQLPHGEMNRGTFILKKGKLYCDYGDEIVMMKLNTKKQQIIYGKQPMDKQ